MDALELRKRAAWLDGCAIRFKDLEVGALLRRYAAEARTRADLLEGRAAVPLPEVAPSLELEEVG